MSSGAEIDPDKLPTRALLDSSVLIPALGDRPKEPEAPACRALLRALIEHGKEVVIAAPSLAEFMRGKDRDRPPLLRNVLVLPFDSKAALRLGQDFPHDVLKTHVDKNAGTSIDYYRYDAMIVAVGLRWNAKMLVSLDRRQVELARSVGMRVAGPGEFNRAQLPLPIQVATRPRRARK